MTTGQMDELEVQQIPVPNQIPNRLDLAQLPVQVLRSAAVEALADQNEDLMARLGVALRRSAQLENRINELEHERQALTHQLGVSKDEVLVLQEKDRRISEILSRHDAENETTRDQLRLLEAQFSELYVTSQERQRGQSEKIENLSREIGRFQRYQRRIHKVAQNLKTKLQNAQTRLSAEEEEARQLKIRLGEAATRIQWLSKQAETDQKKLVENYETALKELRDQTNKLESENRAYAQKTQNHQELFEKTVELENRLIQEQRQFSEYRQTQERDSATLQVEVSDLRGDLKVKLIEIEHLEQNYAEVLSERESLKESQAKLTDQVETLQMLWQDAHAQIEKVNVKNSALQNLNQQMSTTMLQQRQEISQLKSQVEAQSLTTTQRIKEIKSQLQMIQGGDLTFIEDKSSSGRVISRIDTLIAEIQSGFQRQSPPPVGSPGTSSSAESRGSEETSTP